MTTASDNQVTGGARPGPVRPDERAVAPDLARGLMLLLIVLSNTTVFLWAEQRWSPGQHPAGGSTADTVVQVLTVVVLDMRVYPMFAFLLGYGTMHTFLRQTAAGASARDAVRLLRRRSGWLVVFGFAHAALLLATDVLFAYGVIGLVLGTLLVRRGGRVLAGWSVAGAAVLGCLLVLGAIMTVAVATGAVPPDGAAATGPAATTPVLSGAAEESYLASAGYRLGLWLPISAMTVFGFTAPTAVLLGFLAARHRLLTEPQRHVRLLRRTAVAGIAVGWLGGLPAALAHLGVLDLSADATLAAGGLLAVQWSTGLAGGLGYVALFGLLATRLAERRRGPALTAVTAVGRRSLSCYLTHSLVIAPVLAAWGLGLGAHLTSATMAAFATAVWLASAAGAYALDRTGLPGPADALLRRLTYGRRT